MSRPFTVDKKHNTASASTAAGPGCRVLLLVGLPGCGKSTLARSLQSHWHWLDSDTAKLDDLLPAANKLLRHGQRVTIDRCNVTKDERLHILQQLNKGTKVNCIWFDAAEATCLSRVLARRGHATLTEAKMQRKGAEYVQRLISGFAQRLQPPSLDEGYGAVHVANSDTSLLALFEALTADVPPADRTALLLDDGSALSAATTPSLPSSSSVPADTTVTRSTITKFPRTPHLFATGGSALSTDDLLLSPAQSLRFVGPNASTVVVQEKVDGANIGFTLMADWSIVVQNRAHYVTSATHAQFSMLPQWIEQHKAELNDVLSPPGRYTLFGEWCRARHSISYCALPDWFLAFDLFDAHNGRFWSVSRLQQRLADTSISTIPILTERRYTSIEPLLDELKRPSHYTGSDGRDGTALEGVVLRVQSEDGQWLVERTKVVRPEFVQAITVHWSKQSLEKNRVVRYSGQDDAE